MHLRKIFRNVPKCLFVQISCLKVASNIGDKTKTVYVLHNRSYRSFENRDALWYCIGDRTKKKSLGKYKDQFPQIKGLSL